MEDGSATKMTEKRKNAILELGLFSLLASQTHQRVKIADFFGSRDPFFNVQSKSPVTHKIIDQR